MSAGRFLPLLGFLLTGLLLLAGCASSGANLDIPGFVSGDPADYVGHWKGSLTGDRVPGPGTLRLELKADGSATLSGLNGASGFGGGPNTVTGSWRVVENYLFVDHARTGGFTAFRLLVAKDGALTVKYNVGATPVVFAQLTREPAGEGNPSPVFFPGLVTRGGINLQPPDYFGNWEMANGAGFRWSLGANGRGSLDALGDRGLSLWSGTWLKLGDYLIMEDRTRGFCAARVTRKTATDFTALRQTGNLDLFTRR